MGLFDFFKKKPPQSAVTIIQSQNSPPSPSNEGALTNADKERILVQRVTLDDMRQFPGIPYLWNSKIEKYIAPRSHPFAYMNLIGPNVDIAKSELSTINSLIAQTRQEHSSVPSLSIPIDEVVFKPSLTRGYTRLMCTPVTYSGKTAKHPASLHFMTDITSETASTHGELFYNQAGTIEKANIYFWRKRRGHFFYFETVDQKLVLSKIESPNTSGGYAPPMVIYKGPHVLALEAQHKQEEKDYQWLQKHFPEKCPKSITGYRRMKTQNTKNYQTLKQLASEMGRNI